MNKFQGFLLRLSYLLFPLSLAVVTGSDSGWPESCSTESRETLLTNHNQYPCVVLTNQRLT